MGSWEREARYGGVDQEEELLRRSRPTPGKRSLTHSAGSSFGDLPAPGKVPATLSVTDEGAGVAPDAAVRARVEATTGADLSGARVHTGSSSQESASALRASAFTVGQDIHFAAGQYQPATAAGGHLLAHELVHTVQQKSGPPGAQLKSSEVSQEGDAAEVEADHIAGIAMSGAAARVAPVARAAAISRGPATLSGNPAEKTDAAGKPTTSHRSIGVGDAVDAPAAGTTTTQVKAANVKVVASELAPLHLEPAAVCPVPERVLQEDPSNAAAAPAGFTHVEEIVGTVANPQVHQEAAKGIYIGGGPKVDDIQQGGVGDCYVEADLVSIVARDPGKIPSMMAPDGKGGATVTFWYCEKHSPSIMERIFGGAPQHDWKQVAVKVDDTLAVSIANNRVMGAQLHCAPNPKSSDYWAKIDGTKAEVHRRDLFEVARWAPLMEKAYARYAEKYGQYAGREKSNANGPGTSGYTTIDGGYGREALYPFYGAAVEDPNTVSGWKNTAYAPGGSVVSQNAAVMDYLILMQGRGSEAAPGVTDAPLLTAGTNADAFISRLALAIPAAQADPDYVNVDAARQVLVTAVMANITTFNALPADPPAPAAQPKAISKTAIGTSCGIAVRPGVDDSAGEQDILQRYIAGWAHPIQFTQGDATLPAEAAERMKWLGKNLTVHKHPVVAIEIHGHSSSEGSDEVNMKVSQQRVDTVETALLASGAIAPHTETKTAHGEEGATRDPSWRKVDFKVNVTSPKTNSLIDPARSRPIQDAAQLMINIRNMGTDNSPGQRNVYPSHAYSVVAVNIVSTTGVQVPLNKVPAANRAALYPLVDPDVSTVTLRNPHHGNEPDRRDNRTPDRAGDGAPSGAGSDGQFTMTLREFFLNFTNIRGAVVPTTK